MSVHKRTLPSGRTKYEVRWREGNRNKSRMFDQRRDATAFDVEIRRIRQAGELALELDRRRLTVADLAADWWTRSAPALTAKTVENYATQLDLRVLPELGQRRVHALTVADVEHWIAKMRASGDQPPTIIKACTVLQALLAMAVRDGIVLTNVAQAARKPRQGRTRVPYLIKPDKVELMRAHFAAAGRERDIVLLELLAYAGLRPESEAVTLTWRNVRDRSIVIHDTKRHTERSVVLLPPLRQTLNAWRLRLGRPAADTLVVPTAIGNPWEDYDWKNWRQRIFHPAALAAGLPADVRPRDLRGSFVSLLVHEGRSIIEVARQVGHSPVICLRDYGQVFDDADPAERRTAEDIIAAARAEATALPSTTKRNTA